MCEIEATDMMFLAASALTGVDQEWWHNYQSSCNHFGITPLGFAWSGSHTTTPGPPRSAQTKPGTSYLLTESSTPLKALYNSHTMALHGTHESPEMADLLSSILILLS